MIQTITTNKEWQDKAQDPSRISAAHRTTKTDSQINLGKRALRTKLGKILFSASPRHLSLSLHRAKKDIIRTIACTVDLKMDKYRVVVTSIKTGHNNSNSEGRRQRCIAKEGIWVDSRNNFLITLVLDLEEITTMFSRKEPHQGWFWIWATELIQIALNIIKMEVFSQTDLLKVHSKRILLLKVLVLKNLIAFKAKAHTFILRKAQVC